jgi:hypothetical protein
MAAPNAPPGDGPSTAPALFRFCFFVVPLTPGTNPPVLIQIGSVLKGVFESFF